MNIADVHNFIFFVLKKSKNAMVTHEWIDDSLHSAQLSRFSELLPPKPGPNAIPVQQVEYGTTVNGMDYLLPFKKKVDFFQDDTPNGLLLLADDYSHLRAIYVLSYSNKYQRSTYRGVSILSENQLPERLSSQIIMPTDRNPVGIMVYDTKPGIQIYPQKPFYGRYYYFSKPVKPKYAYVINGRTETQNVQDSVDLVWDDESINSIIWKALQPLGLNLMDNQDITFAQYKEQHQG